MSRIGVKMLTSWFPAKFNTRLLAKSFLYEMISYDKCIIIQGGYSIKMHMPRDAYIIEIRAIGYNITYVIIRDTCLHIKLCFARSRYSIYKHGTGFKFLCMGKKTHEFDSYALQLAIRDWRYHKLLNMRNLKRLIDSLS